MLSSSEARRGMGVGREASVHAHRARLVLLALAVALTALLVSAGAAHAKRPNVVVVMSDDQDVPSMKVMDQTNRLLGRKGTTFRNFFATTPLCCPSRATFFTGRYAHNHGVFGKRLSEARFEQFDDRETLPVVLKRAGYRTGHIGKYLNGYGDPGTDPRYIPPGWDEWRAPVRKTSHSQFDYILNEDGRLRRYGHRPEEYQADVYARKAERFISRASRRQRPFFLSVAPSAPHLEPVDSGRQPRPAPRYRRKFEDRRLPKPPSFNEADILDKPSFVRRERFSLGAVSKLQERHQDRLASLLAVDDAVGGLVKRLRRTGELNDTVIMYTSDNGYLKGEHRRTGKRLLYEESARVPLIVRGPGFPARGRSDQLTANIDLAPTVFDLANAAPRTNVDGISLRPLARRPSAGRNRDLVLENSSSTALRTPRYMYAEHPEGERELYVMKRNDPFGFPADPFQLQSRHVGGPHAGARSADLQARLARRLAELRDCSGAACR